jgi:hypothetical protein
MRRISEYVAWEAYAGAGEDSHGTEIPTYLASVSVGVYAFDPGSTSEPREAGRNRVIVEPTIYFPRSKVFGPRDRVTVRGLVYEVEGVTREWRHPNGRVTGNVATVRRVTG